MTPAGEQAYQIMRWAWDDPDGRVDEAQQKVDELARSAPDSESLREIQDAGTMLSRLAGTLVHNSPSILDQLGET